MVAAPGYRDARAEASARIEHRFDVRVLEPSPPSIDIPPFFADDPIEGGEVLPVRRPGSRTWAEVCEESGDLTLLEWCRARWLVVPPLQAVPEHFAETRDALHALAEHLLAPARHQANGKIGLRYTFRGFGTPFFEESPGGSARQLRVEDGVLVDGPRRTGLTTLREAAAFAGIALGAPAGVYQPATAAAPDAPLEVDETAARALGDWFGFSAWMLEQLRAECEPDDAPGRVQLWPEHFDLAVDLGPDGARANYGGSPGDGEHAEPYLYVNPWDARTGDFWNEPFGASLSLTAILNGDDPLAFLRHGKALLRSSRPNLGAR
jgi:hypothetical protein